MRKIGSLFKLLPVLAVLAISYLAYVGVKEPTALSFLGPKAVLFFFRVHNTMGLQTEAQLVATGQPIPDGPGALDIATGVITGTAQLLSAANDASTDIAPAVLNLDFIVTVIAAIVVLYFLISLWRYGFSGVLSNATSSVSGGLHAGNVSKILKLVVMVLIGFGLYYYGPLKLITENSGLVTLGVLLLLGAIFFSLISGGIKSFFYGMAVVLVALFVGTVVVGVLQGLLPQNSFTFVNAIADIPTVGRHLVIGFNLGKGLMTPGSGSTVLILAVVLLGGVAFLQDHRKAQAQDQSQEGHH